MTSKRITDALNNTPDNYIFPFFWQHNEDDETLINEVHAIYNSGIKALCVESRDFVGFGTDCWWHTLDIILAECKKLGMKVWLLDDESFPSGKANGSFEKRPDLAACGITERHTDVVGPVTEGSILADKQTSDEDELVAIIACERTGHDEKLTGRTIDITNNVQDGRVFFDIPEGCWRIMFFYKTRSGMMQWTRKYADMFCDEATTMFVEAVYEEHYKRYKEYFGNTFVGFFSDEPCFANNTLANYISDFGIKYCHFPWRNDFLPLLDEKFEGGFAQYLAALWYDMGDITAKARFEYMDLLSKRYSKNLGWKLGNWCREHGVEYIGHVIEDMDQHTKTSGGTAHYFRALDGQDMGGIDTVLGQTTPGMTDYIMAVPCSYDISEPDFFHFTLPKLAPSHSHIQAQKKGRSMCEIFGAYGWTEGLKMMKWMTDLMLVRGVNHFVPHAFSPKFPDQDCPPHFYALGTNPEYKKFRILMEYMNRVSHMINGGLHVSTAAVLYHAEAEWSSKNFTPCDKLARLLTESQLDFDIVPVDYISTSEIKCRKMIINKEKYPCLLIPKSEYLPLEMIKYARKLADSGVPVVYETSLPKAACDDPSADISKYIVPGKNLYVLNDEEIPAFMRSLSIWDVKADGDNHFLRYIHYVHESNEIYMFTNEGIKKEINNVLTFKNFSGGDYGVYDVLENKMVRAHSDDGKISLKLAPYASVVLVFGELPEGIKDEEKLVEAEKIYLSENYAVSTATEKEYPAFKPYKNINALVNMAGRKELPRFAGHFRYEKTFDIKKDEDAKKYIIELGDVGDVATVFVNGKNCGDRICPPFAFDITDAVKNGENELAVEVTTQYGYEVYDRFSKFNLYEPTGLLGKVSINVLK